VVVSEEETGACGEASTTWVEIIDKRFLEATTLADQLYGSTLCSVLTKKIN
jgi:hypothetical protein